MTFTCPRCLEELEYVPDGCRDPRCPRDTLEHLEMEDAPDLTFFRRDAGALLVLRQQSPTLWRVASEAMRTKVLRGLGVPVLRQATNNGELT